MQAARTKKEEPRTKNQEPRNEKIMFRPVAHPGSRCGAGGSADLWRFGVYMRDLRLAWCRSAGRPLHQAWRPAPRAWRVASRGCRSVIEYSVCALECTVYSEGQATKTFHISHLHFTFHISHFTFHISQKHFTFRKNI